MMTTLRRWLGIASAADVAEARKEASFEAESLWAGYQTMNGRLIAATERIRALEGRPPLSLVEPFPAPTSPQERPEPEGVSAHGSGRQSGMAGLSLPTRGTE